MSPASTWIESPADQAAWDAGCRPDPEAAERVRLFFRFLRHSKGRHAGRRFDLLPWQWERVIRPLFGWVRQDGTRRYRRAGVWVPKKNGKSTLLAGLGLYMLLEEPGAEVYTAGADRDQASIIFNESAEMVERSPALCSRIDAVRSQKRLVYPEGRSVYRALSRESRTKEGFNASAVLFDELHAQPDRKLWDTLRYAGAARSNPLAIEISTAGYGRESLGYERYRYACDVRDGRIDDPAFLPVIYEAGAEEDWKDPAVWGRANPSLGETVTLADMEDACREAQVSAAQENAFRRYRLNQWVEQDVRWLSLEDWDACSSPPDAPRGAVCYGGLDLAMTTDIGALALWFPETHSAMFRFWVPEEACVRREKQNRTRLDDWCRAGLITRTPGNVIDYSFIRKELNDLAGVYRIKELAIDRYNSTYLATQLMGDGLDVVGFGQGFVSMSAPTKELEKYVLERSIRHGGNQVARWMAANVTVEQDAAGNFKPSKKKSTEKVDGIVALIMAIGRAIAAPVKKPSKYVSQGVTTV